MTGEFFDTGIIVGASYIHNTSYKNISISEIDSKAKISHEQFFSQDKKISCKIVINELKKLIKLRRVMHEILILELSSNDKELKEKKYSELFHIRQFERDAKWIYDRKKKLKKYDVFKVHQDLESIQNIFEINIKSLVEQMIIFQPTMFDNDIIQKTKVLLCEFAKNPPNNSDTVIYANATLYNSDHEKVIFYTLDKGFKAFNSLELFYFIKAKTKLDCPDIKII